MQGFRGYRRNEPFGFLAHNYSEDLQLYDVHICSWSDLMKESEAIRQLKSGDLGGLDERVNIYYVQAVRTAYLVLQDPTQAEDVVQGAFLRTYERIDQFDTD